MLALKVSKERICVLVNERKIHISEEEVLKGINCGRRKN